MKILKNKKIFLILVIIYSVTSFFMMIKEKNTYIFTDKTKTKEYTLIKTFKESYKLIFSEYEFEWIKKVGENKDYFAFFFISFENEKEEKNYYIVDKNTNKIDYSSSENIISEKGIKLKNVNTFLLEKGVVTYE